MFDIAWWQSGQVVCVLSHAAVLSADIPLLSSVVSHVCRIIVVCECILHAATLALSSSAVSLCRPHVLPAAWRHVRYCACKPCLAGPMSGAAQGVSKPCIADFQSTKMGSSELACMHRTSVAVVLVALYCYICDSCVNLIATARHLVTGRVRQPVAG